MKNQRKKNIFYKFHPYNTFLFQLLTSQQFYCPNYEQLNDPYDCRIIVSDSYIKGMFEGTHGISKKNIETIFEEFMQNINTRNRQVILGSDTLDSKLAVIDAYYGDFVGVLLKHLSHNVVSFTTNKDLSKNDILMWGHYTGISRGVKLKFNFVQSNMANHLTRVRYEDLQEVNNEGELSQALFRKTKQWKYEQEYRAIRTDDNKMNFESNTLEEITFGYNVGKEDRDTLIKTVKHLRIFPNCQFFRIAFKKGKLIKAQIHIDEFKAEQNVVVSLRIIETVK